ncbi:MAG: tRNA pseudouridine(55) synthase TruB, partial [Caulobacteraceae bacterium]|nr:tRNA pseudouridine(55) synthase TruB [Caulobacteraceae bacterium]
MSRRRRRGRPLDGWLIIDKPPGLTSTGVVNRVRRAFQAEKAGHGGTLDPLATGVLPVAFGAATKTVPYVMDGAKLYRFTLRFGEARDTDDADGQITATV